MNSSIKTFFYPILFLAIFLTFPGAYAQSLYEYNVDFVTTEIAVAVGVNGAILRTEDGGNTWIEQNSGTTYALYGNDQLDGNVGIAVGENGIALITDNGGLTWTSIDVGAKSHLKDVQLVSSSVIFACGDNGTIVKSQDAGQTWEILTTGTEMNLNDLHFLDENVGFAVGDGSVFMTTKDAGNTWTILDPGTGLRYNAVYMKSVSEGTVVGESGLILNTTDGGNSWSENSGQPFTEELNDIKYLSPSVGFVVGNNGFLARTDDGGYTWNGVYGTSQVDLMSVNFADAYHGMSVGEDQTTIHTEDGGSTWILNVANAEAFYAYFEIGGGDNNGNSHHLGFTGPNQFSLSQNYPNPFNPSTKISYNLPMDAKVSVQVFDMTGREARSLVNGSQTAGTYIVQLDAKGLSSGVYFYRITADAGNQQFAKTMKMILTK